MLPTERLDYSAIPERRKLALPEGARLVVWVIVNVEEWDPKETMPRTVLTPPAGGAPMPDIPNWAWHEYGNRVGFWRMLDLFDDFRIPAVLAINGSAIARYGAIVKAARERQWEFIGHGFSQKNMQKVPDEREDIVKTTNAIRAFTGRRPRGWLGPGLTETWETPDILAELGQRKAHRWIVGFALESQNPREHALRKLKAKHCDAIVLNHPGAIGAESNRAELIDGEGRTAAVWEAAKTEIARSLIAWIDANLAKHRH